jgi:aflatoxin B1 aldehyde reductase
MAEKPKPEVKVVFGTMTLGKTGRSRSHSGPIRNHADSTEPARVSSIGDAGAILDVFQNFGLSEVDTARGYSGGTSEEYLAELKWQERGIVLATKLSPAATPSPDTYTHKPEDLRRGIQASLAALKTDKLDLVSSPSTFFSNLPGLPQNRPRHVGNDEMSASEEGLNNSWIHATSPW